MSIEDKAQEHEAAEWERRQSRRPAPLHEPGTPGYGPELCESCDDPMPALRRAHGWVLCTSCKSKLEKRR